MAAGGAGILSRLVGANAMVLFSMKRVVVSVLVVAAAVLGAGVDSATAAVIDFDPGVACAFPLRVDSPDDARKEHEFTDANGNVVRLLLTGLGTAVTLTNMDTNASLSLSANGSVWNIVNNPDGTSTYTTMGHLVLILFPTDIPAGPSTTLYVGRVVFTVDNATGVFTFQQNTGTATDLCAALSS